MRNSDEIFYNWIVEGKSDTGAVSLVRVMAIDARRAIDEFIRAVGQGCTYRGEITSVVRDGAEPNGDIKYYNYEAVITTPQAIAMEKRESMKDKIESLAFMLVEDDVDEMKKKITDFVDEVLIEGAESK